MKKIILFITVCISVFGFELKKTYSCETVNVTFVDNNKTVSVPNTKQTKSQLQAMLKDLYDLKIKPDKGFITVYVGDKSDNLPYVRKLSKEVKLYKTKDSQLYLTVDDKTSRIAINIPSEKSVIFYQCK